MNTAQALLQTQLAIHMYSTNPSVENLAYLHQTLFVAKSLLPGLPVLTPVSLTTDIAPKERVSVPRVAGDEWKRVNLDRLYRRIIQTCSEHARTQSVAVRIQTSPYVFTEVLIGRILVPLQIHFEPIMGFDHAYKHVIEPVFLHFVAMEGKPYNPEDAFRSVVAPNGTLKDMPLYLLTRADSVFLMSVLDTYDTSRFRTSPRKGTVHIMFNPKSTRSARDLTRDYFIERFNAVRNRFHTDGRGYDDNELPPTLQFQPTRPSTPESDGEQEQDDAYPEVVSDVFASVFGKE